MRIVKPEFNIWAMTEGNPQALMALIEKCGRLCYKSEGRIADGSADTFLRNIIKRGHEAVLEHGVITAHLVCDRGVSHELVRHRIASYCQESTRYCNYFRGDFGSEITVIEPLYLQHGTEAYDVWEKGCRTAEMAYFDLLTIGETAQEARAVLPNSLKTEIAMTMNIREWRHFFRLRCSAAAHPQMREVATIGLQKMYEMLPVLFEDVYKEVL